MQLCSPYSSGLHHSGHFNMCADVSVLLAVVSGLPAVLSHIKHTDSSGSLLCLQVRESGHPACPLSLAQRNYGSEKAAPKKKHYPKRAAVGHSGGTATAAETGLFSVVNS